jgi:hypothetical protein
MQFEFIDKFHLLNFLLHNKKYCIAIELIRKENQMINAII